MERILSTQLPEFVGQPVQLAGWLHNIRRLSKVTFLVLRDRTGLAQVVVEEPALLARVETLARETVVEVRGLAVAAQQAPGGVEVHSTAITLLSEPDEPPPFDLFRPTLDVQLPTLLDHAALTLRHPQRRAHFALAAASVAGFRSALNGLGFTEVFTPKIVASATEGGANVFQLDYFGRDAYLAQSPQFYKQTLVGVFERVYEVAPVFRAEPHDTPRHLSEYVSLDLEMGFIRDHTDVMAVLTQVLRGMLQAVTTDATEALKLLGLTLPEVPSEIPVLHFADALQMVGRDTGEDLAGETDLAPAHERRLGEWARREHRSDFLFVTGYPTAKRPFYTHPDPQRPEYTNSFDLLFRGLELVTGGQRLHRYQDYLQALERRGMASEPFAGYLDAFKYGMPPHGGCALGLERWVARLAGVANVRETTLFPRDLQRLLP